MEKISILLVLSFLSAQALPQIYTPAAPGSRWSYKMPDGSFEDHISEEKFIHKNIAYTQKIRNYSDETAEVLLSRSDRNGNSYYLDSRTFMETLEIPARPKLNFEWTSTDNMWQYQIIDLNGTFKYQDTAFKNCLVIKADQISSHKDDTKFDSYLNYYVKGIGYVGSTSNGEVVACLYKWSLKIKRT